MTSRRWTAFHAPMKAPDHPTPSGDREIARLTLRALEMAGLAPRTVSSLRTLDKGGDSDAQDALFEAAVAEADKVIAALAPAPPAFWFTYHCHYKAPDLIGPIVSHHFAIPYVISEPSISAARREGPWASFAKASEMAIADAALLFWTTSRDRPALEAAGHGPKMRHLPAFVDPGPPPVRTVRQDGVLRLLTVAMMRPGDKVASYRRLAAALDHLDADWHLTVIGGGAAEDEVHALFGAYRDRISFLGIIDDPFLLRTHYESADVFAWPGVGEGVGMVFLEAQAAGLPVVSEDHAAQRDVVATPLVPAGDARAFAAAIRAAATAPGAHETARVHVESTHSLGAAARQLRTALMDLAP